MGKGVDSLFLDTRLVINILASRFTSYVGLNRLDRDYKPCPIELLK